MKIANKIPYRIKRILPILGMAGATLFTSCERDDPVTPPEPIVPTTDIELTFVHDDLQNIHLDTLVKYAIRPDVRNIYMVPTGHWNHFADKSITNIRRIQLAHRLNVSPKIRGRGNFDFSLGAASRVPDDSLWYVENGWTINAHLIPNNQNQR